MTIAYADFVAAFPEFSNAGTYPATQINFWIPQAYAQLNPRRFGVQIDLAAMLYVAHNVVLSARAQASANAGQVVGEARGLVASKSVGDVSVSYDTNSIATKDAGIWMSTVYGQRLYKMMQTFGGPVYAVPRRRWTDRGAWWGL